MMTAGTINVEKLNSLDEARAGEVFLKCSGSPVWRDEMIASRPFSSVEDVAGKSLKAWGKLSHQEWLDSFKSHPKIGEVETLRKKFASTAAWASNEQAGVNQASEDLLHRLAAGNNQYEQKFGHIFIVCASGKSAAEMLALLEGRLSNSAEVEFETASHEQKKITQLRLEKLEL